MRISKHLRAAINSSFDNRREAVTAALADERKEYEDKLYAKLLGSAAYKRAMAARKEYERAHAALEKQIVKTYGSPGYEDKTYDTDLRRYIVTGFNRSEDFPYRSFEFTSDGKLVLDGTNFENPVLHSLDATNEANAKLAKMNEEESKAFIATELGKNIEEVQAILRRFGVDLGL